MSSARQTLVMVTLVSFGMLAFSAHSQSGSYRQPTPEEQQWFNQNATVITNVQPNELGKSRIEQYAQNAKAQYLSKNAAVSALPDNVDNSALSFFPPVSSQGSLNCCAAFSTTYYQFSYMNNMANNTKADVDANRASTKWTFDFVNDGGNNGTNFTATYMILKKNGSASLKDMPYDNNCTQWNTTAAVWRTAMERRIDQIGTLGLLRTDAELENLKKFLNNGYIIAFSTSIGNWQYIKIKDDPATTADNAWVGKRIVAWTKGDCDHAMCIVGYNDNIWCDLDSNGVVNSGEKGALRIVNSWGTGFEDKGFTWIAYDALTKQTKVPGYTNALKENLIVETAWCTAKKEYKPRLIGEFTLNSAKRNQIVVKVGYSATDKTTPVATLENEALNAKGGALAFDGSTTAKDGTFCLDFTDLINANALVNGTAYRWYIQVTDKTNDGTACIIKNFSITDTKSNKTVASSSTFPQTADGSTVTCFADLALSQEYQIKATTTRGGTLSQTEPVYYEKNSTATVSVTVDSGFILEDAIIDGVSSGAKASVTFANIAANHTVSFLVTKKAETGFTTVKGIDYKYYEGFWDRLPDFSALTAKAKGKTDSVHLFMKTKNDSFGVVFTGFIYAPEKGDYVFTINSDDGSRLLIGKKVIANYDGLHNSDSSVSGSIRLEKGYHSFTLEYFDHNVYESLKLSWSGPSFTKRLIGASDLSSFGGIVAASAQKNALHFAPALCFVNNKLSVSGFRNKAIVSLVSLSGKTVYKAAVTSKSNIAFVLVPASVPSGHYVGIVQSSDQSSIKQKLLLLR